MLNEFSLQFHLPVIPICCCNKIIFKYGIEFTFPTSQVFFFLQYSTDNDSVILTLSDIERIEHEQCDPQHEQSLKLESNFTLVINLTLPNNP